MARYQVEVLFEVEIDGTEQIAQEMVDQLLDLLVTPHLRPNVHWEIFPGSTRVLDELAGFIPTQKEDSYDPPRWGQQPNEPIVPIFNNNADPDDIPEDDGDEVAIDPRDLGPIDPDEIFTPMMGWQSCRYVYEAPGDDGMDDYYRCIVHDTITIGHEVSCEEAGEGDVDLPEGYRWATADESEESLMRPNPAMIVVPRTVDREGKPYTQGEADLALPIKEEG